MGEMVKAGVTKVKNARWLNRACKLFARIRDETPDLIPTLHVHVHVAS